ncbi:Pkinase-domain-containing protein [Sistotremastrum niveocremeum HHB9708]|uniref:Pkinase-domain-containing protein n=1 Tax=Sistotremastrum niveocremeum HHB9708 TaxID=1314777 RepID=A0A164XT77_9AGAM|nr:Pkinase-domain-containing protein [Sistotremastrum niveocremeum HHB9708]
MSAALPIPKSILSRRAVFGDVNANYVDQPHAKHVGVIGSAPHKITEAQPSSPPLPRQNTKTAPPSPPSVIVDKTKNIFYTRTGFLGEGGFARVYEVKDDKGNRQAIKVVTKASLKTKKAKTKLYAEIKIHRSIQHPNVVKFFECFEDSDNVYMTLELCEAGSLMETLRRRKRFTEPEARVFMIQVVGACNWMHSHQIIHRDLKLGNLFLDSNMNVKVGDFGLAALIENPGERKKTICGTPNYIAPEILFDTVNGHSFEVDAWSIGVILYTLIIGRPPFQTKDVKAIYKRIRDNMYEWPVDREVSVEARTLVQRILIQDPNDRPTLYDIADDAFFTSGTCPSFIPIMARDSMPNFSHISRQQSAINLARLRKLALIDDDQQSIINDNNSKVKPSLGPSAAQQERDFLKAVQPGSPISALLSSARQPLLVSAGPSREPPLIRKLQSVQRDKPSPKSRLGLANIVEEREDDQRKKELESQKARIVAQMAPPPSTVASTSPAPIEVDDENVPPPPSHRRDVKAAEMTLVTQPCPPPQEGPRGFETFYQTLNAAFEARAEGYLFRNASDDVGLPDARVFIVSWVDYCNKYGMGYALTDGSVGVHFNDSTSIVMSPDKMHVDYVSSRKGGGSFVRKSYQLGNTPEELKNKIYLLKHFEKYMMDRLYGEYAYVFKDTERTTGMDFVQKYLRMKQVIVFKLSHDVLQFNFYDHSKLILSSDGLVVTHIDKHYNITRWTLSDIMQRSMLPPSTDPAAAKLQQRLMDRLRYSKEVLISIRNAQHEGTGISSLVNSVVTR